MSGKKLPQPTTIDDITTALRGRRAPEPAEETAPAPRTSRTRATPKMDRRSWYMPTEAAAALAALVDDLHYETRRPKHEVLAAVVAAALEQRDAVRQRLTQQDR